MVTDDQVCLLPPPASVFARLEARVLFRLIGAGAVKAVRLLMVDALHFVAIVQAIPCAAFVRTSFGALGDASADE